MKTFREKFVHIFIVIRVICVLASVGLHTAQVVEIVQGKASIAILFGR
jgi:hypothetical protein